jgi:hypothetical protein
VLAQPLRLSASKVRELKERAKAGAFDQTPVWIACALQNPHPFLKMQKG